VASCGAMGYSLGLDQMLKAEFAVTSATKDLVETGRSLWWSIFIVERMIAIHHPEDKPSFGCQSPDLDDLLPLNITAPKHQIGITTNSNTVVVAVNLHRSQTSEHFIFAQTAQAAYLLNEVIETMFNETENIDLRMSTASILDARLQVFLLSLYERPKTDGLDACSPYAVIVSGLLLLNLHRLNLEYLAGREHPDTSIVTTLRSLLLMGVQTIQLIDRRIFEYVLEFPFWTMHFPYFAAILLVECENTGLTEEERLNGLRYIRDMFIELETRWRIGGRYLEEIVKREKIGPRWIWEGPPAFPDLVQALRDGSLLSPGS